MSISGLKYVAGYIIDSYEAKLLDAVDAEPWRGDLKRRVQHYGYRYDYTLRKVEPSMYLGPLPAWAQLLAAQMVADGHMPTTPDQLIVNEYEPGQGINAHVDCVPCFGPVVCSITLGSQCVMELSPVEGGDTQPVLLERGSLLVLAGDSRYKWRHGIPGRKTDTVGMQEVARGRRVSLTFRNVILERDQKRPEPEAAPDYGGSTSILG